MTGAYRLADGIGFHVDGDPDPVGYLADLLTGPIMVVPGSALTIVTTALSEPDPLEALMMLYPDVADVVRAEAADYLNLLCDGGFLVRS